MATEGEEDEFGALGHGPLGEGPLGPGPEEEVTTPTPTVEVWDGTTVLQRHKADPPQWRAGAISRKRYQQYKAQWARDAINAERELKRQKRKQDEALARWKIEDDKPLDRIWQGDALFHDFIREFERQQTAQATEKLFAYQADLARRLHAAHTLQHRTATMENRARALQLQRDLDEEGEALELMDLLEHDA